LLHVVDIAPLDEQQRPADQIKAIEQELRKFSDELAGKPRWLVLNKVDLIAEEDLPGKRERLLGELRWDGPVFEVSAATGAGTEKLGQAVMRALAAMLESEAEGS
jgi:GTP-binding protein